MKKTAMLVSVLGMVCWGVFLSPTFTYAQGVPTIGMIQVGDYQPVMERLEGLGYSVTLLPVDSGTDAFEPFNIVYLPNAWASSPQLYETLQDRADDYHAFVHSGGGLMVDQPNPSNLPDGFCSPSLLPYTVELYYDYNFGDYPPVIADPDHFITQGLTEEEMPFPADRVSLADESYDVLVRGRATNTPSLLVAEYGSGRVLVQTSCPAGGMYEMSDEVYRRMLSWVSRMEAPVLTLNGTDWFLICYEFSFQGRLTDFYGMQARFIDMYLFATNEQGEISAPFSEGVIEEGVVFFSQFDEHGFTIYAWGLGTGDRLYGKVIDTRGFFTFFVGVPRLVP
ncbi:MAG: hypothetical protein AB1640_25175 [bacterium]